MILVTGGAGFIGSNLVAGLEARGCGIVICDSLGCDDKWRNIAKRQIAGLIAPSELLPHLELHGGEIHTVFHLGAISSTTETDADLLYRTNAGLTLDLWRWCTQHRKRLIYASSAATYGDGAAGFDDDAGSEALARLRPLNGYAWSKHVADRQVSMMAGRGLQPPQWAGLKFFNVYGPNEHHKGPMRSVALQLFEQASRGEPIRLFRSHRPDYPDGGQLRDFIWVDDCVAVMLWLLDHPGVSGLFNVGTGRARSFLDLARAVTAACGNAAGVEFIDTPEAIRARYQYFTQARMDRLRAAGYERPFTELEEGVTTYVRDYLQQPDPYR